MFASMGPRRQIVGLVVLACALFAITIFIAGTGAGGAKDLKVSRKNLAHEGLKSVNVDRLQRQALWDSVRQGQVVRLSGVVNLDYQFLTEAFDEYERTNGTKPLFFDVAHSPTVDIYVKREDADSVATFLGKLANGAGITFSIEVIDSVLNNRTNWIDGPARMF